MRTPVVLFGLMAGAWSLSASAEMVVTPLNGQTPETVQKDQSECQALANQAPAPVPESTGASGERVRGAARGAAAGAVYGQVKGEVRGDEAWDRASDDTRQDYRQDKAKTGAAIGVVAGGSRARRERRAEDGQAQASAQQSAAQSYATCLQQRGYQVQ